MQRRRVGVAQTSALRKGRWIIASEVTRYLDLGGKVVIPQHDLAPACLVIVSRFSGTKSPGVCMIGI